MTAGSNHPRSKRLRRVSNEDRLSNLPHAIISEILSCLPTKNAVRTSVLSRNWRYMWTSIHNIKIDDENTGMLRSPEDRSTSFRNFVTQVLLRTCCDSSTRLLKSFDLLCDEVSCQSADLETWILGALMRNAEILNVSICNLQGHDSRPLWCFTGWMSSLRELRLALSCTVKFPSNNCFPNLKWLFLGQHPEKEESIKVMTTTRETSSGRRAVLDFPVLERIELWNCEWLEVNVVEIQAPELISFKSAFPWNQRFTNDGYEEKYSYEIKLFSPKLAMFESFGPINNYVLATPAAVTYASLHMNPNRITLFPLRAHKVLRALPHLKSFKITGPALKAMVNSAQRLVFPTLNEVKEVEVGHCCRLEDVMILVRALPSLESLLMSLTTTTGTLDEQGSVIPDDNTMSKLRKLHVYNFRGCKGQYDVVKYFMKNAKNLQEITIWVYPCPRATLQKVDKIMRHLISKLKLRGLTFALQRAICQGYWAGLAPTLVMGQGGKTQLATTSTVMHNARNFNLWART